MKNILSYTNFINEAIKGADLIYKDKNLVIVAPLDFDGCNRYSQNTIWCSSKEELYYYHSYKGTMYRFLFKDGTKIRLTWNYFNTYNDPSNWALGGKKDHEFLPHLVLNIRNEDNPFEINYLKNDERKKLLVDKINEIPFDAIEKVIEYQEMNKEKVQLKNNEVDKYISSDIKINNIEWANSIFIRCKMNIDGILINVKMPVDIDNFWDYVRIEGKLPYPLNTKSKQLLTKLKELFKNKFKEQVLDFAKN